MRNTPTYLLACALLLAISQAISAQIGEPADWTRFTRSEANPLIPDTFRMQTFAGLPTDNWNYTVTPGVTVAKIPDNRQLWFHHGAQGLRIPLGDTVAFAHFPLNAGYQSIQIVVVIAGEGLKKGEELRVRAYRPGENSCPPIAIINKQGLCPARRMTIKRDPPGIDLLAPEPLSSVSKGYYYADSLFAYGNIPAFSLFTGKGSWEDTARWSHLPPARHRKALIQGVVKVNQWINCEEIAISEGALRIGEAGEIHTRDLRIYADPEQPLPALRSNGKLRVTGQTAVVWRFPEKGRWYFLSLPFDLYAEGFDPAFRIGDELTEGKGNYVYLRVYDGDRRAREGENTGNWRVVSPATVAEGKPLIGKNRGFLIAIDEGTDRSLLRLSSKPGDTPADLGRGGAVEISMQATKAASDLSEEGHTGWYLCGNPLPAPLPLSRIEAGDALDGFVYLYDGEGYRPYPLDSDLALPPFAAFFVRASRSTRLTVRPVTGEVSPRLLAQKSLSGRMLAEPTREVASGHPRSPINPAEPSAEVRGRILHLHALPSAGMARLFSPDGRLIWHSRPRQGDSSVRLSVAKGIYLLQVEGKGFKLGGKVVVTD